MIAGLVAALRAARPRPCAVAAAIAASTLAPASNSSAVPFQGPTPRTPSALDALLALEGPLDNDTDDARHPTAGQDLAAGDVLCARSASEQDPALLGQAFEAWRRVLLVTSPLDAVERDSRTTVSVGAAVRARIAAAGSAAFRARFEPLAERALDAAGGDDAALERVEHEHPFTLAGRIAALRRCDLACERGAFAQARAALERAQSSDPADASASLDAALAQRRALLPALPAPADASVPDAPMRLGLERVIDLGQEASPEQRLRPGAAFGPDGRVWIQAGESLVELDMRSQARRIDTRAAAAALGASWLPCFGDKDRPWLQQPALAGPWLCLVAGRARAERGNALCLFDLSASPPRLVWVHGEAGFAHASGERADAPQALLPGRLEFQPGPLFTDGLVIVQVLQWEHAGQPAEAQRVDGARTSAWLVAFESASGHVAWKRRLATGADRRARVAQRFAEPRGVSCSCLPLALCDGEAVAVTELGIAVRVRAGDGVLHASWRLKRAAQGALDHPPSGGPFTTRADTGGARVWFAPADADGVACLFGAPGEPDRALRVADCEDLLGARGQALLALVRANGRSTLAWIDTESGARAESLPLGRAESWKGGLALGWRVLAAAGGMLRLHDAHHDLARVSQADLEGLDEEASVGVLVHAGRVHVIGLRRAWVIALE